MVSARRQCYCILAVTHSFMPPIAYAWIGRCDFMSREEQEGKDKQVKGKVREEIGKLIDDKRMQTDGKIEQTIGKVHEEVGKAKKKIAEKFEKE